MKKNSTHKDFLVFLIEAKKRTYAAQGDDSARSNPLLPGALQLEWRSGDWLYRDVYFGMTRFTGMETVYAKGLIVWAMSYSGGMEPGSELNQAKRVYSFLRSALGLVSSQYPFRGPPHFSSDDLTYRMILTGDADRFEGTENIQCGDTLLYALGFAGGRII